MHMHDDAGMAAYMSVGPNQPSRALSQFHSHETVQPMQVFCKHLCSQASVLLRKTPEERPQLPNILPLPYLVKTDV